MADDRANIPEDDMSNDSINRLILDQISSLRVDVKEQLRDVKDDVRDMSENLNDIVKQLGGQGGIRERLTALEARTKRALDAGSSLSYPPPESEPKPKKRTIRDHAPVLGAGAGITSLLYAAVEIVNAVLKTK